MLSIRENNLYSPHRTKYRNTLCGQKTQFFKVKRAAHIVTTELEAVKHTSLGHAGGGV